MDKKTKLSAKHYLRGERTIMGLRHILHFVMITIGLIFLSVVVSGEDLGGSILNNNNIYLLIGMLFGLVFAIAIIYIFYNKGLLSFLNLKTITDSSSEKNLLVKGTKNIKKSFIAYSGEFPSSIWDDAIGGIINFANKKGKENIKLMAGQVVCIGSLKNKKEGKEFYSQFLKEIINAKIPLYKTVGKEILPHLGERHFRVIDGVYCVYHYHYDRKIRSLFNKNSYFLGANFKKRLNEYVGEGEEFSLGKAETDGTLVIELEGVNEKGLRYEYATKEQIDGFKKYINN